MDKYYVPTKAEKSREHSRIRHQRMAAAKLISDHEEYEWIDMLNFFEHTCAICFIKAKGCIEKDHIQLISMGGSNGICNLQPLCPRCNKSKGTDCFDYRFLLAYHLKRRLPINYRQTETNAHIFY